MKDGDGQEETQSWGDGVNQSWYRREGLALFTDFYELTMGAGQWREGRADQRVCFEYFFRKLPPQAGFAIAAGLQSFLDYLERLRFASDDLAYLRSLAMFDEAFLDFLKRFRPQCSVRAIPEGTLVFPNEPIVQIEGNILEVQLVETALLNFLNFQTLIATKAARICLAANYDPIIEFGLRRAQGPDGGLSGSRAAHIGGCTSTSNVLAGKVHGIPVSGTHAHSWVMSFPSELEAFRSFARQFPETCVLLVDTYDTIESGVPNAIRVYLELKEQGKNVRPAIRLDSGDLAKLSKKAYEMIVAAGLENPLIVASNDLEEDLIADLKRQGAKINAWGVGTHLITAHDSPALGGVYKLVAVHEDGTWRSRMKITSNLEKSTDPGRKKIIRYYDGRDCPVGDIMYQEEETAAESGEAVGCYRTRPHLSTSLDKAVRAEALLQPVFVDGVRVGTDRTVSEIRDRAMAQVASLPEEFKRLRNPEVYQVLLSQASGRLKAEMLENPLG